MRRQQKTGLTFSGQKPEILLRQGFFRKGSENRDRFREWARQLLVGGIDSWWSGLFDLRKAIIDSPHYFLHCFVIITLCLVV
jgi:hypothetical protein